MILTMIIAMNSSEIEQSCKHQCVCVCGGGGGGGGGGGEG